MKRQFSSLALLAAASLLATGCATVFLPKTDGLEVVTDPPGAVATCGDARVVTPGVLQIPRQKEPVTVRVEKEGFQTREIAVGWSRSGVIWVNAVGIGTGAMIGAAVNAWGTMWNASNTGSATAVPIAIGAGVTAGGLIADLTSSRTYTLERDALVLRLEPVPQAEAMSGGR